MKKESEFLKEESESAPKNVWSPNFMTGELIFIPQPMVDLFELFKKTKIIYQSFIPKMKGFERMAEIINKKVPDVFNQYFDFIDSLKLDQMSDQDIVNSSYYFYLYGLADEFNKLLCFLLKAADFNVEDKYLELSKRNKKLLKRLAKLDFAKEFSEEKINEYHDNIYYLLLSEAIHLQPVFTHRKDFISGLKISEKIQGYREEIKEEQGEQDLCNESLHLFFLCDLYNDVQNYEKSFSLFKEASEIFFKFVATEQAKKVGASTRDDYIVMDSLKQLLASIRNAAQSKKPNLLDVFITEIPKFYGYIRENKNFTAHVTKAVEDAVSFFYQEYFAFLKQKFNSKTISFDLERRCLILKPSNINPKAIFQNHNVNWFFNKNKGYVVTDIHLMSISQIESLCTALEGQEIKVSDKAKQQQAKKETVIPPQSTPSPQVSKQKESDNNNCNNSQDEQKAPEKKLPEEIKKTVLTKNLKASDLGFDKKYDDYEIYEIEKQGVKGVFYGFFKPAKKQLLKQERLTEEVLTNHKNILSKEKTVGTRWEKGIKFVPLNERAVNQYRQELKQQAKNKNNENNNNVSAEKVNLTLKLGYTFKTKPLTKDVEFLAKVSQIIEDPRTGKQKILFRFGKAMDHKSNDDVDVMKFITKTFK